MAKIKEKGHNINLANIVVHKINKNQGSKDSTLKLANRSLNVNKAEVHFIADVRESFNKKSLPTHGVFEDTFEFNGFQQAIKEYKDGKIEFMAFTTKSMQYYKRVIENSAPATGGFIIFADFILNDKNEERFIFILAINNKQGYNLSEEELSIQQIKNLELSKMDLAAIINLTRWNLAIENASDVKTYLSFIRGKKKISDYFQNFIGCADKTTATDSSTNLLNAIESYFVENNFDESRRREIKRNVFEHCQVSNKAKREILLSNISMIVDVENPEKFSEFANSDKSSVSEVIKYDGKILRSLKFIEYKSEDFSISVNKGLIGKSVKISPDKKVLTISNLPEDLVAQF